METMERIDTNKEKEVTINLDKTEIEEKAENLIFL